ncbi:uncharacterized protein A4U43_C04F29290 [Asparagus officinalis]|uniref:Uncharacterized protein n=1 Tax=Asparagus officinalis TaxID=4686 RepID=A0A5P1F9S7_ASPOF|nr:uncharacterized protein A4U43_C04F29290 [Asparagus officinalis]
MPQPASRPRLRWEFDDIDSVLEILVLKFRLQFSERTAASEGPCTTKPRVRIRLAARSSVALLSSLCVKPRPVFAEDNDGAAPIPLREDFCSSSLFLAYPQAEADEAGDDTNAPAAAEAVSGERRRCSSLRRVQAAAEVRSERIAAAAEVREVMWGPPWSGSVGSGVRLQRRGMREAAGSGNGGEREEGREEARREDESRAAEEEERGRRKREWSEAGGEAEARG